MGFEGLLGNRQLRENLTRSLKNNHISHFYLISGPEGSGKRTLAGLLSAAMVCRDPMKPCLRCNACRKVMENTHPDVVTVDDPEKKTVTVDLIRQARSDIFIQPNEADRKIYLIPRAQDMLPPAQNALLKVLEEPPKYGVFLLLTDNPERLLPTVRSRCTLLQLRPLDEDTMLRALEREFPKATREDLKAAAIRSGGWLGQAKEQLRKGTEMSEQTELFLLGMTRKDPGTLIYALAPMEKWKREQVIATLQQWLEMTESALACRSGMPAVHPAVRELSIRRSPQDMMRTAGSLQKAIEYAQQNISVGAICGWLSWELREM